jgi:SagB-type dehydrogenase family enzyme
MAGTMSVAEAINRRRTVRSFSTKELELNLFSQLLWSAQGITDDRELKRAAPSAGALFPMEIYAAVGDNCVPGLKTGVYRYLPEGHSVKTVLFEDVRQDLARASLFQMWMSHAPLNVVIMAEYDRITGKYGRRGVRYAWIEAGHIAQNIFLQAEALGLRAGIVGAFRDEEIGTVLGTPRTHEPLLIIPVGYGRL